MLYLVMWDQHAKFGQFPFNKYASLSLIYRHSYLISFLTFLVHTICLLRYCFLLPSATLPSACSCPGASCWPWPDLPSFPPLWPWCFCPDGSCTRGQHACWHGWTVYWTLFKEKVSGWNLCWVTEESRMSQLANWPCIRLHEQKLLKNFPPKKKPVGTQPLTFLHLLDDVATQCWCLGVKVSAAARSRILSHLYIVIVEVIQGLTVTWKKQAVALFWTWANSFQSYFDLIHSVSFIY